MSALAVHEAQADRRASARGAAAWLVLAVVSLLGFILLTVAVNAHVAFFFDQPLLDIGHRLDGNPLIWQVVSETANIPLIVIGVGSVLWLLVTGHRREALVVLLMLIAVTAGSEAVKQLTHRSRPEAGTAAGIPGVVYSYPSGHVLEALTILGFVGIRTWHTTRHRRLALVLAILIAADVALVAVARVSLAAHFPTDVLASILGGLGALGCYAWLTRPGGWAGPGRTRAARSG